MTKSLRYLLDVNLLIALLDESHVHHELAKKWLKSPGLEWTICPFSEAGFLRHMSRPKTGGFSVEEATAMLASFIQQVGYRYEPLDADWRKLTHPFSKRILGHKQITDAYLLGLAIQKGLILVTFDKGILHMAGEHGQHVLLLPSS